MVAYDIWETSENRYWNESNKQIVAVYQTDVGWHFNKITFKSKDHQSRAKGQIWIMKIWFVIEMLLTQVTIRGLLYLLHNK